MITVVDGVEVHGATGGVAWADRTDPVAVLEHGAGMDSTVWNLQTRYLGARGVRAVAVDLPGHGSTGPAIETVEGGLFLVAYIEALGVGAVTVIGHSMGTFARRLPRPARPRRRHRADGHRRAARAPRAARRRTRRRRARLMSGWSHDPGSKIGPIPPPASGWPADPRP